MIFIYCYEVTMQVTIKHTQKDIVPYGGLPIVGSILKSIGLANTCNDMPVAKAHPLNKIECSDIISTCIAIMCTGQHNFEVCRDFELEQFFIKNALGLVHLPSAERFRQRLDLIVAESDWKHDVFPRLVQLNQKVIMLYFKENETGLTPIPSPLFLDDGQVIHLLPVDIDVTPYDESKSHKEGATVTYKNFIGYAPINAHIGMEGFMLDTEFRIGKQHCQKDTPEFITETIRYAEPLIKDGQGLLFRLDSGNDAVDNMAVIMHFGHYFIIKRNLRKESLVDWWELAHNPGTVKHTWAGNPALASDPSLKEDEGLKEGVTRYVGSTWREVTYTNYEGKPCKKTLRIVFEVIETTIDEEGQLLLNPKLEVNTWWTNTNYDDKTVIDLYHKHGTMEQYHAELKTDQTMEKLPSGKFGTNMLIHTLSMIAYNILRLIGYLMNKMVNLPMRGTASRRRIGTVIKYIIRIPCIIKFHANRLIADVGGGNPWCGIVCELQKRLT